MAIRTSFSVGAIVVLLLASACGGSSGSSGGSRLGAGGSGGAGAGGDVGGAGGEPIGPGGTGGDGEGGGGAGGRGGSGGDLGPAPWLLQDGMELHLPLTGRNVGADVDLTIDRAVTGDGEVIIEIDLEAFAPGFAAMDPATDAEIDTVVIPAGESTGAFRMIAPFDGAFVDVVQALPLRASSGAWSGEATLTVHMGFYVMTAEDDGPGSLRETAILAGRLGGDAVIRFSPAVFHAPTTIQLMRPLFLQGGTIEGPTVDGEPLVRLEPANDHRLIEGAAGESLRIVGLGFTHPLPTVTEGSGCIQSLGELYLDATVFENCVGVEGGAIHATGDVFVRRSRFEGNQAMRGGAIFMAGSSLELSEVQFRENEAAVAGGAVFLGEAAKLLGTDGTFESNRAEWIGGEPRGGAIAGLARSHISIRNMVLAVNVAHIGGAIAGDSVVVYDSTLGKNRAELHGGGIATGSLVMGGSTLAGNTAGTNGGAIDATGTVWISNSTLSGNRADENGGAVHLVDGLGSYFFATFTKNHAVGRGGGMLLHSSRAQTFRGVVVAGNTAGIAGPDLHFGADSLVSQGYNFIGDIGEIPRRHFDIATDWIGTDGPLDPQLGGLRNNGGKTSTHLPLEGSPLVDLVPEASCLINDHLLPDQRGVIRPVGTHCDIGAVEVE